MKYKIFSFFAALTLLMTGCAKDEAGENHETRESRIITVAATLPNDGPQSRISLHKDSDTPAHAIQLYWENDDKLMLCFSYNSRYYYADATIIPSSITDGNGKTARFAFSLPEEIPTNATFRLGVIYQETDGSNQNGGHFEEGTLRYIPESKEHYCFRLDKDGDNRIRPILRATQENATVATLSEIELEHLGFVVALHLKNKLDEPFYFDRRLQNKNPLHIRIGRYGYELFYSGSFHVFATLPVSENNLSHIIYGNTERRIDQELYLPDLPAGESMVVYRWVMSKPSIELPELNASIYDYHHGSFAAVSVNNLSAGFMFETGNTYHVYLELFEISGDWRLRFVEPF